MRLDVALGADDPQGEGFRSMPLHSPRDRFRAFPPMLACLLAASVAAGETAAPSVGPEPGFEVAPYVAQILQVAALDPALAVTLIPDPWVDFLVASALAVEAEIAARPSETDPPRRWPIGPWSSPRSLAGAIRAIDSGAVAALYRELKPRLAAPCRQRGASLAACDRALRASGAKLSARSVLDRAANASASPITPTQRELARLGVPVVTALRDQIRLLGIALWGPSWSADG